MLSHTKEEEIRIPGYSPIFHNDRLENSGDITAVQIIQIWKWKQNV